MLTPPLLRPASHPLRASNPPRRRALLSIAHLALLGAVGLPRTVLAQSIQAAPLTTAQMAWRAMSRLGYGPSPALVQSLQAAPSARDWSMQQVDSAYTASQQPPAIAADLTDFNAPLPQLVAAARRERELRNQVRLERQSLIAPAMGSATTAAQPDAPSLAQQALRRMDFSAAPEPQSFSLRLTQQTAAWRLGSCSQPALEDPLLARMTEFWFNHLNVFAGKGAVRPFVGHYLVNIIRPHAMGKFEDLLLASARHPAMLLYLDQAQSVADGTPGAQGRTRGLNENYARELMELHTLGVNGGYSQTDVHELARVLTGWTVDPTAESGFRFAPRLHDNAPKRLLGQIFPANARSAGEQEGIDAIRLLARHPATARRISLRLAQFFVADKPTPALVQQLSQSFLSSGGDLRTVMKVLLSSSDFWAQDNRLFKTPLDFACSALAAVTTPTADRRGLTLAMGFLAGAGQPLHGWQTPDGYAFDAATWLAPEALTRRADFALNLARQLPEPEFLKPYFSGTTLASVAQERPALRAGLMLASPDFMYK